jgi:hypothetical protein
VQEPNAFVPNAVDVRRLVAQQSAGVANKIGKPDVVAPITSRPARRALSSLNRPAEFGRLYDCAHSQRNSLVLGLPVRQFRSIAQSAVARLSNIQRAKTLIRSL